MSAQPEAKLIIAASEHDSNLFYASHFLVPDPVIYFEIKGKRHLVLSDLEIDRAKSEARVHHIHSLTSISKIITKKTGIPPYVLVVDHLFKKNKIKHITLPSHFPSLHYEGLKKLGYKLTVKADPFYEERLVKTPEEREKIRYNLDQMVPALGEAVKILQKSKIKGQKIYYGKEVVTSDLLRSAINTKLMELGCVASHTIVASGVQGSFPHHEGHGPIIPHTPIIFDIFPRHSKTLYWGDMTRTMVKGKPKPEAKKMYEAVLEANKRSAALLRDGAEASKVHGEAVKCLEKRGFKTGFINGRMQGFIHSTGHGLGLDIHELPSVSSREGILKQGHVVTIEPGLYYQKWGGVRIEDVHYITKTGSTRLTSFPQFFEIDG